MYKLNILLASSLSKTIGMGHFSRMLALRNSLVQSEDFHPYFSVLGDDVFAVDSKNIELDLVSKLIIDYFYLVKDFIEVNHVKVFIMDLHKSIEGPELRNFLIWAKAKGIVLVAIDSLINYREYLDHVWLPSVHFDLSKVSTKKGFCDISFGWDHFLLPRSEAIINWQSGRSVLVMTGGADVLSLSSWLPELLDTKLVSSSTVHWIQGPYANHPNIPVNPKLTWNLHESPKDIAQLISESSYVLTQFGVSFFESVQYGIPTVIFPLDPLENSFELDMIQKEKVALVAPDIEESVNVLVQLMGDDFLAKKLSKNSQNKMSVNGCDLLINKIKNLMSR